MSEKETFTALLGKGKKQGLTAEEVQELEKAMKGLIIVPSEMFKDLKLPSALAFVALGFGLGRLFGPHG